MFIKKFEQKLRRICEWTSFIIYGLVLVIVLQVLLRYVFGKGEVALEELNWHFYAILFMTGLTYAELENKHVGVDLISSKFSAKTKGIIGILGYCFLLLPFLHIIFYHSLPFVYDSFRTMEKSLSPSGLSYRFLIKSLIPITVLMLASSGVLKILHFIKMIRGEHGD